MKATKICKVCGCEYEACHTLKRVEGLYRWQDVACSPEHGAIYLKQVLAARGEQPKEDVPAQVAVEEPSELIEEIFVPKRHKSRKSTIIESTRGNYLLPLYFYRGGVL